ncbi:PAS domain-containing protein [Roseovarius spongiae]|uniref:PAS domain-containing protein n=1 Tax=Roseovarius spongiae TaxID=2320272 RepID=A0A3A8AYC1_9RHOB|nr:PAS domain-containing protein [Roseovarius spongiae]RKF15241.1 PAS domain-containing protein [Roseovarius spongiae]
MCDDTPEEPPKTDAAGRRVTRRIAREDTQLADFVRYWDSRREGGDAPYRSEIDPRGIRPLLSNALIAERIAPGIARLRVAGAHLSDLMGMEVRGMPLSAFIAPEDRDALADHLVRLFDEPATVRLTLSAPGGPGRAALGGTLVLLPLRSDLGDVSRALGCLVTHGQIGAGPRRLNIDDSMITPLGIGIGTQAPEEDPELAGEYFAYEPRLRAERPYLRLIRDN